MMWRSQRRWLIALMFVFVGAAAQAFDAAQVYGYLERLHADSGSPGISAAVAVNGEIVFSGGVGVSDLQSGMPQNALPTWAITSGEPPKEDDRNYDYTAALVAVLKQADAKRRDDLARDVKHQLALKGGPENVRILEFPNAKYVGKSYAELMKMRRLDEVALAIALQKEGNPHWAGGARMRSFSMAEEDIVAFHEPGWAATSTDGWVVLPEEAVGDQKYAMTNRRCFGSYPRRLAYYSQQLGVDTLEHAVRSASGLPAEILRLQDRGRIAAGMKADLVVLDLGALEDNTTFLEPSEYPSGIEHVLVNGRAAVEGGQRTLALAGRVLSPSPRT